MIVDTEREREDLCRERERERKLEWTNGCILTELKLHVKIIPDYIGKKCFSRFISERVCM